MASVAISERILRQVVSDIGDIVGLGDVFRLTAYGRWWDGADWKEGLANTDALVVFQGEQEFAQALGGDNAPCYLRMSIAVVVVVVQPQTTTTSVDAAIRNWVALVRNALMGNPTLIEDSGSTRLAIDTRIVNVPDPVTVDAPREMNAMVFADIDYIVRRNNAYLGPGISELIEG